MRRLFITGFLVLGVSQLALAESKFHALEGCWAGSGKITLISQGTQACPRIVMKYVVSPTGFTMQNKLTDCPAMGTTWDLKGLELRNNTELWGGASEKKHLGWLEKGSYWFDEPVTALQYVEFRGTLNSDNTRLSWLESFTHNQKNYWKIEADLAPIACDQFSR